MSHYVPLPCREERCSQCGKQAAHKVEETLFQDDATAFVSLSTAVTKLTRRRHPYTTYLCCRHFEQLFQGWHDEFDSKGE